ncbi:DUF6207 family protein [Streptomyces sp. NPDC014986]
MALLGRVNVPWRGNLQAHGRAVPGEPGVRLRCYLDVRQELGAQL